MATQQSTPVRLPPGVSENEFAAAVEHFESAIGSDQPQLVEVPVAPGMSLF